ncbi:ZYRO0B08162p [Zygosaccharomyces rouxii]|uniref:ZYRO0B08162p n=1 Tax=Zygosaccharomyces rouxii (strain ATCC 2623 / CBS 732 / NBRC 1130 / NCYC 568 / NRRL Y-229) TaxID=559307 RepID=C5DRG0_ZYGRC|nr:uncharacterized protein ZYRO0B08162g [Zygosaccharomyces rouxii]CAR26371.1 ZYRO0B08162p [Zygosaccharomyces rouxii]
MNDSMLSSAAVVRQEVVNDSTINRLICSFFFHLHIYNDWGTHRVAPVEAEWNLRSRENFNSRRAEISETFPLKKRSWGKPPSSLKKKKAEDDFRMSHPRMFSSENLAVNRGRRKTRSRRNRTGLSVALVTTSEIVGREEDGSGMETKGRGVVGSTALISAAR